MIRLAVFSSRFMTFSIIPHVHCERGAPRDALGDDVPQLLFRVRHLGVIRRPQAQAPERRLLAEFNSQISGQKT